MRLVALVADFLTTCSIHRGRKSREAGSGWGELLEAGVPTLEALLEILYDDRPDHRSRAQRDDRRAQALCMRQARDLQKDAAPGDCLDDSEAARGVASRAESTDLHLALACIQPGKFGCLDDGASMTMGHFLTW